MRRVLKYVIFSLLILLLLSAAAVELVLRSDIPRPYVIAALEERTGLNVHIGQLRATWRGETRLTDFSITLPLDDKPLFEAHELTVDHTALLWLLLRRDLSISSLTARQPLLRLTREDDGRWNVQRLVTLLAEANEARDPRPRPTATASISLPRVTISDATVELRQHDGRSLTLQPVRLEINPQGPRAARLHLQAQGLATLDGRVMLAGDFQHEIQFALHDLEPLADWFSLPRLAAPRATGQWRGRVVDGVMRGKLDLERATLENISVKGDLEVLVGGASRLELLPGQLTIAAPAWLPQPLEILGGRIALDDAMRLRIAEVRGRLLDATWRADGLADLKQRTGDVELSWREMAWPQGVRQEGGVELRLISAPGSDQYVLQGQVRSEGKAARGAWSTTLAINARGADLSDVQWTINKLQGVLNWDGQALKISDAEAGGILAWPSLGLEKLILPLEASGIGQGRLAGTGIFDFKTQKWSAEIAANEVALKALDGPPLAAHAQAQGSLSDIDLRRLDVTLADLALQANAQISLAGQAPFTARYTLAGASTSLPLGDQGPLLLRDWTAKGELSGWLKRQQADYTTTFHSPRVTLDDTDLGGLTIAAVGRLDPQSVTMTTQPFALLDALVTVDARHRFEGGTVASLDIVDFDLARLDAFVNEPLAASGVASGTAEIMLPTNNPETLAARGTWRVRGFNVGPVAAQLVSGRFDYGKGMVRLSGIEAVQSTDQTGQMSGELAFDVIDLRRLTTEMKFDHWRMALPATAQGQVLVSGTTKLDADLTDRANPSLFGQVDLGLAFLDAGQPAGDLTINGKLDDDVLEVKEFSGHVFSGQISGGGAVAWNRPMPDQLQLNFQDIDARHFAPLLPMKMRSGGRYSGRLVIQPTTDKRAPASHEARLQLQGVDGHLNDMGLKSLAAAVYYDNHRFVLHETRLEIAGGELQVWGRLTRRQDGWFVYLRTEAQDLELAQLVSLATVATAKGEHPPLRGNLSGTVRFFGPLDDWTRASGAGSFTLARADLARLPLFDGLYNLLNLRRDNQDPDGSGQAALRLEGKRLTLTNAQYQNRGTSMNLLLRIEDLTRGGQSPIQGFAVADTNPLPNLPFVQDFVDALVSYQGDVTSARIDGTLDSPQIKVLPLRLLRDLGLGQKARDR